MKTIITASSLIVSVALLAPGAFAKAKEMTGSDRAETAQSENSQADSKKGTAETKKAEAQTRLDAASSKGHDKRDAKRAERGERRGAKSRASKADEASSEKGEGHAHKRFGKHGAHPGKGKGLEKRFARLDTDASGSLSFEEFTQRSGRDQR